MTELQQLGDGVHPVTGKAFLRTDALADVAFLRPSAERPLDARSLSVFDGPDLRADLQECVARLRARDLELLMVDKTRPDLELSVVQAIVPGLRHFWPRLGPGRLYDVPVRLGWRALAHTEDELTQVPLVL